MFEALDLVLAAAAVAALALAALHWSGRDMTVGLVAASMLPLLVVASQLLNDPPAAQGRGIEPGAWLALAGAAVMTAGAVMSLTGISLTVAFARRDEPRRVPSADADPATGPGDRRNAVERQENWWERDG